jgi:hypothetical protein
MKKNAVITTYYCKNCGQPTKETLKTRFNYDGNTEDFFINFSNDFDPWNIESIPYVGPSKRKDLVFGKIFKLKTFIENHILGEYENILHIDYSDTKFARSSNELFENFINSGKDIVISTEINCWPYLNVVSNWFETELPEKQFHYVNSGAIISKTERFYEILKELELICLNSSIDFWDDQGVWQYYNLKENNLSRDENSEYFFSTAELDDSYYKFEDGVITTKFGTKPYLIHDNSSFSLNLIKKI